MLVTSLQNETEVLQRMQNGDHDAFSSIYRHYHSSVLHSVLQLIHSAQLAEDLTQEIFLKLWEVRGKLSAVRSFRSYLFTIARNHTLNALKSAARSEAGLHEIIRQFEPSRNITEEQIQADEYFRFIRRKFEELPPRTREIFHMCRDQEKTYEEVAAALGITRDAVKSRMTHAMKILKDAVGRDLGLPAVFLAYWIDRL